VVAVQRKEVITETMLKMAAFTLRAARPAFAPAADKRPIANVSIVDSVGSAKQAARMGSENESSSCMEPSAGAPSAIGSLAIAIGAVLACSRPMCVARSGRNPVDSMCMCISYRKSPAARAGDVMLSSFDEEASV
jgi:hypothetical protein